MQNSFVDRVLRAVLAGLLVLAAPALAAAPKKSPFVEILGQGTVVTAPRQTTHKNRRKFLEFEITLSSARATGNQPPGADIHLALDTSASGRVRVVHDLSCGGAVVALAIGDRIEIQGEYVHVPKGQDLIHFTHAADGKCGRGQDGAAKHPGGFLKKVAAPVTPRPVAVVPDQPYTGPPPPQSERPYAAILTAKQKGASNAELLAKVENEHKTYSLTTPEIQNLRAAGVSEAVIEAMLRSERGATPPAAAPAPTPR